MTLHVELIYTVKFSMDTESANASDAIEFVKTRISHRIAEVREAGCEMSEVHVTRRPS